MPAKRALVYVLCPSCRAQVPLAGLVADVGCSACDWRGAVLPDRWDWVVADEPASFGSGREILGETVESDVTCRACNAAIADAVIERAAAARAPSIACSACQKPMTLRALPEGDARPTAWRGAHASFVVGEGVLSDAPVNVPCSKCGAPLVVDGTTPVPTCAYCQVRTPLPRDVWQRLRPRGAMHPFFLWMSESAAKAAFAHRAVRATRKRLVWIVLALVALGAIAGVVALVVHAQRVAAAAPPYGFGVVGASCDGAKAACSLDKKTFLKCEADKWVVGMTCRGPAACRLDGDNVHCDYTRAIEGDPCDVNDYTCAADGKSELRCDGAHFVPALACKGPDGCTLTPSGKDGYTLSCDFHVADVGDACLADDEWACSSDMKSELRCASGHFVVVEACRGAQACRVTKNRGDQTTTVSCDGTIADVGDTCVGKGSACTSDGRSQVTCTDGHFVRARPCPHGCTVHEDDIVCR